MLQVDSVNELAGFLEGTPNDWSMSEKMDGINAAWDGKSLLLRCGKAVDCPPSFLNSLPTLPCVGELWTRRGGFDEVLSIVKRGSADPRWASVSFIDFSRPGFHVACGSLQSIARFFSSVIARGGEGIVVKDLAGTCVKIKQMTDADAQVVGYKQRDDRISSLRVRMATGIEFYLGSGLTKLLRYNPPRVGSIVTFRYSGLTSKAVPREAVYLRQRAEAALV